MVWKQDLAKLKQVFPESGGPPPPVKPRIRPVEVKDLVDEDAFFLAAMGTPAPRAPIELAPTPALRVPAPPLSESSFQAEISDLKGLKPLTRNPVLAQSLPASDAPPIPAEPAPVPVAPAPEPILEAVVDGDLNPAKGPLRIQLAAGMAVEVDATLDLRNHTVPDAMGRLRDRIEDGTFMGWRTLHVTLGEGEALHAAFLALLTGGGIPKISRYAQAPIPMGGAQAWVLYY